MQTAEAVLDALHSLGQKRRPLRRVYRVLYNPQLLALGLDADMRPEIPDLIQALRSQRFRWRRNPRQDRIVSRALNRILGAYLAAQDSPYVHGLRAGTGIHSALKASKVVLHSARWLWALRLLPQPASLPAQAVASLACWVDDGRFQELTARYFTAYPQPAANPRATLSQALSPDSLHGLLCHLSLRGLDAYLTETARHKAARGLRFVRYMNWLLIAGAGSEEEAARLEREIRAVLHGQALTPAPESAERLARGTPATIQCEFLGYEMALVPNAVPTLRMPRQRWRAVNRAYTARGKSASRGERVALSDDAICTLYDQEFGAVEQYYALAENRHLVRGVQRTMRSSLLRTLAHKHKCRVNDAVRYLPRACTDAGHALLDNVGPTQFQVTWIDDVQWRDPEQAPAGEPCAVKVARTVRREA